jgi:hypothetical protein
MHLEAMGQWDQIKALSERFAALVGKRLVLRDGPLQGFSVKVTRATSTNSVEVVGEMGNKPFKADIKVTPDMLGLPA